MDLELKVREATVLASGFAFGESPRWHDGRLWFANWGTGEIVTVDDAGDSKVVARIPTTLPCSIDWLPDGRMLIVSGPEARLLRHEADGSLSTHAELGEYGSLFNEIVVDSLGNSYVNGGDFDPNNPQEAAPGVIVLVRPDGATELVATDISFGNGMVITADGSTLIVAESWANRLTAFDVADDGTLLNRRVWADLGGGYPDGICLDADGAVWFADVPNEQCVRVVEGGEVVDTVTVDRGAFACMLGGKDGRTLYITASVFRGFENMGGDDRDGVVVTSVVETPGAGRPSWNA
jgi:sugar lactone lactonase YvrE